MESALALVRDGVRKEYSNLITVDGMTQAQLADLLAYETKDMVYKIANPHTTTLPPLDRHLLASKRLSEQGNIRLARFAFDGLWNHTRGHEALTNASHLDEHRDMDRAQTRFDEHIEAGVFGKAEDDVDEMQKIVNRYRAELNRKRGANS